MSSVVIAGDTSGSITIAAPNVAGTNTLTLPAATGTILTSASNTNFPAGSVVQVVSSNITANTTTTSTTYVDTSVSLAITPKSASNKVLILISPSLYVTRNGVATSYGDIYFNIVRTSTEVNYARLAINYGVNTWSDYISQPFVSHLDSPATTSSTTYKMQIRTGQASISIQNNVGNLPSTITLIEIAA